MPVAALNDARLLLLNASDNVFTATSAIESGAQLTIGGESVVIGQTVPLGFKVAARSIAAQEKVIKYGVPIGSATRAIQPGEIVHVDNMKSDYIPTYTHESKYQP